MVDPKASEFPWQSGYASFDNNPINKVDPDGMEATDIIYRNRLTGKEVGRIIMSGKDVYRTTDARNLNELVASNFDGPRLSAGKMSTNGEILARQHAYETAQLYKNIDYQDMSQPTTSLAIVKNVAEFTAYEYAGAKILSGAGKLFEAFKGTTTATEATGGLNLFKFGSPQAESASGWKSGDNFLKMFDQGSPKLNWKQNSGFLRTEMGNGKPIFDSFLKADGTLQKTGGFLNAERNLLQSRGWNFNSGTGAWMPPR